MSDNPILRPIEIDAASLKMPYEPPKMLRPCCGFVADLLRFKSLIINRVADVKDFQTSYDKYTATERRAYLHSCLPAFLIVLKSTDKRRVGNTGPPAGAGFEPARPDNIGTYQITQTQRPVESDCHGHHVQELKKSKKHDNPNLPCASVAQWLERRSLKSRLWVQFPSEAPALTIRRIRVSFLPMT